MTELVNLNRLSCGSFVIFRGSGPVLPRNPIYFSDISGGGGGGSGPPISPSGSAHATERSTSLVCTDCQDNTLH